MTLDSGLNESYVRMLEEARNVQQTTIPVNCLYPSIAGQVVVPVNAFRSLSRSKSVVVSLHKDCSVCRLCINGLGKTL